jgi:uncharacterized coiled-coil protein SlyX
MARHRLAERGWVTRPRTVLRSSVGYARTQAMNGSETSIVDLQLRFMKLERELAELSGIVAAHQRTIDTLKVALRQQRAQDGQEEPALLDQRPPHY